MAAVRWHTVECPTGNEQGKPMAIQLSEAQQRAVEAPADRPSLILAAAGSGKTLVLCHRILRFISQGVPAKDILALTFSRRAGQDLLHRLHTLAAPVAAAVPNVSLDGIRVCTFHSFCLSVLRMFPNEAGLSPNFIVFTPKMQLQLLEDLIKKWHEEKYNRKCAGKSGSAVSPERKSFAQLYGKNTYLTEAYCLLRKLRQLQNAGKLWPHFDNKKFIQEKANDYFEWVYEQYLASLKNVDGIDFSDFPRLAIKVLQSCQKALTTAGLQAQYVLVDEFQDTDAEQFKLLSLLCRDHKRLTIVGDDDQQIYSWRGAAGLYNLSLFDKVFHGAIVTKLEQNFRSTGAIVAAARAVIVKNVNRTPKTIWTVSPTAVVLSVCECRNEQCEAAAVAKHIGSLKEEGVLMHEIAILYRVQHVGLELQKNLQAQGISCSFRGDGSGATDPLAGGFLLKNSRTIDLVGAVLYDILAVLRLILCESDNIACKQVMDAICPTWHSSVVSTCTQHYQLHNRTSFLEALKCSRSHLLGLKKHESLLLLELDKQLSPVDKQVIERVHLLMKILESTKEDLKHAGMKNAIMNLLQQLPPLRGGLTSRGHTLSTKGLTEVSSYTPCNLEFAGVKALLKEASQFDKERDSEMQSSDNTGTKSNSYQELMQQRKRRQSLRQSYESSPKTDVLSWNKSMQQLRNFLDLVLVKIHDGELGECGGMHNSQAEAQPSANRDNSVILSTIHQAKGLEWRAVILVRANETVLPLLDSESIERVRPHQIDTGYVVNQQDKHSKDSLKMDMQSDRIQKIEDNVTSEVVVIRGTHDFDMANAERNTSFEALEEERRLMYVALTRAKQYLMITHVMFQGQQILSPSRFLADIPKGLTRRTAWYDSVGRPGLEAEDHNSILLNVGSKLNSRSPEKADDVVCERLPSSHKKSRRNLINQKSNRHIQEKVSDVVSQMSPSHESRSLFSDHRGCKRKSKQKPCVVGSDAADLKESLRDIDNLLESVTSAEECLGTTHSNDVKGLVSSASKNKNSGLGKKPKGVQNRALRQKWSDDSKFEDLS